MADAASKELCAEEDECRLDHIMEAVLTDLGVAAALAWPVGSRLPQRGTTCNGRRQFEFGSLLAMRR